MKPIRRTTLIAGVVLTSALFVMGCQGKKNGIAPAGNEDSAAAANKAASNQNIVMAFKTDENSDRNPKPILIEQEDGYMKMTLVYTNFNTDGDSPEPGQEKELVVPFSNASDVNARAIHMGTSLEVSAYSAEGFTENNVKVSGSSVCIEANESEARCLRVAVLVNAEIRSDDNTSAVLNQWMFAVDKDEESAEFEEVLQLRKNAQRISAEEGEELPSLLLPRDGFAADVLAVAGSINEALERGDESVGSTEQMQTENQDSQEEE